MTMTMMTSMMAMMMTIILIMMTGVLFQLFERLDLQLPSPGGEATQENQKAPCQVSHDDDEEDDRTLLNM